MKDWRGKRILGMFLSVALVLSTLDVSTLTVTAKEGNISDGIISEDDIVIMDADSAVNDEETVVAESDIEISSEEIETTEVESTVVSESAEAAEVETTEVESTIVEDIESAEIESTEMNEETKLTEAVTDEVAQEVEEEVADNVVSDGATSVSVTFSKQPVASKTVTYGYEATELSFDVALKATGAATINYEYQWQELNNSTGYYDNITGAISDTYVPLGKAVGKYSYRCVVNYESFDSEGNATSTGSITSDVAILTVEKKSVTFESSNPVSIKGEYGETIEEMSVVPDTATSSEGVSGSWKMNLADSEKGKYPKVGGQKSFTVVFTPDDSNYGEYSTKVYPTVSPKTVYVSIDDKEKEYGEENPKLTFVVEEGGLVGTDKASALSVSLSTKATETSPVTEEGYEITGTSTSVNYNVEFKTGILKVKKKAVTVKAENKKKSFGDDNPELTFTHNENDLVNGDTVEKWGITLNTTAEKNSNVVEEGYPITGTSESDNYDVTVEEGTLTVIPLKTTFDASLKPVLSGTYGETLEDMLPSWEDKPTTSAENQAGVWSVKKEEAGEFPAVGGEKEYTLIFTPENSNYATYSTTVIPTVKQKDLTVKIVDTERPYKEKNPEFEIELISDDALVPGDSITDFAVTYYTEADIDSVVTTEGYEITGEAIHNNYNVEVQPGTLKIVKANVRFADGEEPVITGKYGTMLSEMKLTGPTTSQNEAVGKWELDVTEEQAVVYPEVGGKSAYKVVFTLKDTDNYNEYSTTVIPTVTQKEITVKAVDTEKFYGQENPDFSFDYNEDDLVGTDKENAINILRVSLSTEAIDTSDVTEEGYQITGTSESKNYAVKVTPGTLMIKKKTVIVEAVSTERVYGKENPQFKFTYSEDDLVGDDTVDDLAVTLTTVADVTSPVNTEEGYLITGSSTSKNYEVTVKEGILKIIKADIEFADGDTPVIAGIYGQTLAEMSVTGPAISQNGATGKWSLGEDVDDRLLTVGTVEEYSVIFTPDDIVNYNPYPNPETQANVTAFTEILPKEITVQAENKTKVYGEDNPKLTFKYRKEDLVGEDGEDALRVTLTTEATKDSVGRKGGYPITGTSESVNYAVTVLPGILTITQAEATITIAEGKESYEKSYGGADFALEGITTNSDGAFVYTLSGGMDVDGQAKAEEEIITVSPSGVVTITGSGSVIISVTTEETSNFKAAEPKQIKVQVVKRDGFFIKELPELTYNGKAQQPEPEIYDGATERKLVKGTDYTLSYKNTVKAYNLSVGDAGFKASKAPQIIIKGKGNYTQKLTVYYTIQPKNINSSDIWANDFALEANGKVQTKVPVITYGDTKLSGVRRASKGKTNTSGKDFIYSYPALDAKETKDYAFKEKGTYRIAIEGTGNYTGSRVVKLTITDEGMALDNAIIEEIPAQSYQKGNAVTLDEKTLVVTTMVAGESVELKRNIDYTVKYRNNIDVGTATVIVTGKGSYAGTQTANFEIAGISLDEVEITGLKDKTYSGEEQTQALVLTVAAIDSETGEATTRLLKGRDYRLTYKNNVDVGTAEVTVQGIGGYTGTVKMKFKIMPYDISAETDADGTVRNGSLFKEQNGLLEKKDGELAVKYTKGGAKPDMQLLFNGKELVAGKDYVATYKNNKVITAEGTKKMPVVTIKGKGNFKGSFKKTYMVVARSLNDSDVPVTMTVADKAVSGKAGGYISKPVLTDADGKVLKAGKDYTKPVYSVDGRTLDKTSTVAAGKVVTVTVKGLGAYTGEELSATYCIRNKSFNSVKIKTIQKVYSGEEVILTAEDFVSEGGTSKITFGKSKEALVLGTDFEIVEGSYKNNLKKGTASVTLRGLGEYGGTKTIKFKIVARGLFRG